MSSSSAQWEAISPLSSRKSASQSAARRDDSVVSLNTIHCCVKLAPTTEMGSARMMKDATIVRPATTLPASVTGTTSP